MASTPTLARDGCPGCGSYNLSYSRRDPDGAEWSEYCRDCHHMDTVDSADPTLDD